MTKARDIADIASNLSANAGKAIVVNNAGNELVFGDAGSSDIYGFEKYDSNSFNLKDSLKVHYTGGSDDLSVAHNNSEQTDLYDESFIAKRNLSFSVNSDGELVVTV
jgi:hypothetical protein